MARNVARTRWNVFLAKAEDFLRAAQSSHGGRNWNACVSASVHAGILACDVVTVGVLGKRNTGEHDDLIPLLAAALDASPKELSDNQRRIRRLLEVKNVAEYEDRLLDGSEASSSLKDGERLVEFARRFSKRFEN